MLDYFASPIGRATLKRIHELKIKPEAVTAPAAAAGNQAGPFAGKTCVLTGTLSAMTREAAGELIRQGGGTVSGSVSKKTDYVVVGDNAGTKAEKAEQLGVPVLDEEGFRALLESGPPPAG